jgi:hypothetical protein
MWSRLQRRDHAEGSNFDATVHLVGQLSNLSPRLQSILDLPESRVKPRTMKAQLQPAMRKLGNGVVQRAVVNVLSAADCPMRRADIRSAVERQLGQPVSKESVSWCLRMGIEGPSPRFERAAHGVYRLRDTASMHRAARDDSRNTPSPGSR